MSKVILVTGISYGLGKTLYERLQRNPGFFVAGIARTAEDSGGEGFMSMKADITDAKSSLTALERVKAKRGGIDVLINNAGIVGEFKRMQDYTADEVTKLIEINVKGTFLITQKTLGYMRRPGYIINIGSTRSITGAPNKTLYSMTKFALRGLTQSINSEMKKDGIYSTIVCPGSFGTVPLEAIAAEIENLINLPLEAHVPELIMGGML